MCSMQASETSINKMAAIISQQPVDGASAGICTQLLLLLLFVAAVYGVSVAAAACACVLAHSQTVNCLARSLSDLG